MRILGHDFTVRLSREPAQLLEWDGQLVYETQEIVIGSEMPRSRQISALLHEILHAVAKFQGVALTETDTQALEVGLLDTLIGAGVDLSPLMEGLRR